MGEEGLMGWKRGWESCKLKTKVQCPGKDGIKIDYLLVFLPHDFHIGILKWGEATLIICSMLNIHAARDRTRDRALSTSIILARNLDVRL